MQRARNLSGFGLFDFYFSSAVFLACLLLSGRACGNRSGSGALAERLEAVCDALYILASRLKVGSRGLDICASSLESGGVCRELRSDALVRSERSDASIGILSLVGVFVSAISGMLYKIVPFIGWLKLAPRSGSSSAAPMSAT